MRTLRTKETENQYTESIKSGLNNECFFCEKKRWKIVKEFENFVIVKNDFPYDEVAEISHILFPRRHITRTKLNDLEIAEIEKIKVDFLEKEEYAYLLEGLGKKLSIPGHFHLHAIRLKDR